VSVVQSIVVQDISTPLTAATMQLAVGAVVGECILLYCAHQILQMPETYISTNQTMLQACVQTSTVVVSFLSILAVIALRCS
jgi:hypothetical protein